LRARTGLSQEALGEKAGLHRTVVGLVESGKRDIGVSALWPLADALGVQVSELFQP
jgi:transcriptional regulator with XRE-family HTH domain